MSDIYNEDTTSSFSVFALFSQIDDELTFEEAVKYDVWTQAMGEEIDSIERNDTLDLVGFPKDKDCIGKIKIVLV